MNARALLGEVAGPVAAASIGDDDPLRHSGLDSADLVRLVLLVEERLDVALDADDVDALHTLGDVDRLLARFGASAAADPGTEG